MNDDRGGKSLSKAVGPMRMCRPVFIDIQWIMIVPVTGDECNDNDYCQTSSKLKDNSRVALLRHY